MFFFISVGIDTYGFYYEHLFHMPVTSLLDERSDTQCCTISIPPC